MPIARKQHYHSIDVAKLAFVYLVVVWHSRLLDGIIYHGYLSVEFFFIISGFFVNQSAEKYKTRFLAYIRDRLKKLYPHYLFSFLVMLFVSVATGNYVHQSYNLLAEILLIQDLGFTNSGINYPCWYLSVLFWGALPVLLACQYLPKCVRGTIGIVLPILYFAYSIIFEDGRAEIWNRVFVFYLPVIRGISMISLGAMVYDLHCVLQNKGWYKRELLLQITEVVAFVAVMFFLLCPLNLDCLAVIFFCIFLLSILHKNAILEKIGRTKPFRDISQIEYAVYLNHAAIVLLFNKFVVRTLHVRVAVLLILLIVAVSLYSATTTALMGKIQKRLFRM